MIGQTVTAKIIEKEELIKMMVSRFLCWKLPADFSPDCGISFTSTHPNGTTMFEPVGTNLFTAEQAEQMVRHMLGLNDET